MVSLDGPDVADSENVTVFAVHAKLKELWPVTYIDLLVDPVT